MRKRGQFYIVGAFIIVMIITGLVYIYTSAEAPEGKISISDLADEAHYETRRLVDNRLLAGSADGIIVANISDVVGYYANKYPYIDIAVIYGNESVAYIINATAVKSVTPIAKKLDATLRGSTRTFEMKIGKNIFIMAISERDGEKSVVAR